MTSTAATVDEYLAELPEDRREAISAVRQAILKNLPKGYEEGMMYGAIGYYVPHSIYPAGYHCDPKIPLPYAGLASQKNYMTVSMGCVYGDESVKRWFVEEYKKTGKRLDMGESCIRFRKLDDLPVELVGKAIKMMPVKKFIAGYEETLAQMKSRKK